MCVRLKLVFCYKFFTKNPFFPLFLIFSLSLSLFLSFSPKKMLMKAIKIKRFTAIPFATFEDEARITGVFSGNIFRMWCKRSDVLEYCTVQLEFNHDKSDYEIHICPCHEPEILITESHGIERTYKDFMILVTDLSWRFKVDPNKGPWGNGMDFDSVVCRQSKLWVQYKKRKSTTRTK